MKRDMDLFREILVSIEEQPAGAYWTAKPLLEYSIQDVVAHVRLINDAGLVEARFLTSMNADGAIVLRITNAGYDFLEASRQKTLWEQAKHQLVANGVPLTVATIRAVLQKLIEGAIANLH